jgi:hypothetical protein
MVDTSAISNVLNKDRASQSPASPTSPNDVQSLGDVVQAAAVPSYDGWPARQTPTDPRRNERTQSNFDLGFRETNGNFPVQKITYNKTRIDSQENLLTQAGYTYDHLYTQTSPYRATEPHRFSTHRYSSTSSDTTAHPSMYPRDNEYTPSHSMPDQPIPSYLHHNLDALEHLPRSESAPPAQSTRTYQPREIRERYKWDVDIPYEGSDGRRALRPAVALLDTQSQGGNWITCELLLDMNKWEHVSRMGAEAQAYVVQTASGLMSPIGTITFAMKRLEGNRYFDVHFFVCPRQESRAYDIILGRDFINEHEVLVVNRDALLPLLVDKDITPGKYKIIGAGYPVGN